VVDDDAVGEALLEEHADEELREDCEALLGEHADEELRRPPEMMGVVSGTGGKRQLLPPNGVVDPLCPGRAVSLDSLHFDNSVARELAGGVLKRISPLLS
jgi:hypothetical protein